MGKKNIFIVILLIFVIGGGYWLYELFSSPSAWEVYRNKEHGFEIEYPSSWYSWGGESQRIISTLPKTKYESYYGTTEAERLGESYGLIWISFPSQQLEEYFELTKRGIEILRNPSSGYDVESFVTEELTIAGSEAYKLHYKGKIFSRLGGGENSINIVYLISPEEKEGIVKFEGSFRGEEREKHVADFNDMISTLKFLE